MRPINLLVIHCSGSPNGQRVTVEEIDAWHADRGFARDEMWRRVQNPGLKAIGYHYLIYPSGTVVTGRAADEIGAHVSGFNRRSVGVCLIGTDRFTAAQWSSLAHLVTAEVARVTCRNGPADRNNPLTIGACTEWADHNGIRIEGHRDIPGVHKDCPGFSVAQWVASGLTPLADHLLEGSA